MEPGSIHMNRFTGRFSEEPGRTKSVGEPRRGAIEAEEAGLLDSVGPAGETDLDERARAWAEKEGIKPPSESGQ